eukprot:4112126-Amphidinium_carterae.1
MNTSMLCIRSYLHGMRELLPTQSAAESQVQKLKQKLASKMSEKPSQIRPQNIYIKHVMAKRKSVNKQREALGQPVITQQATLTLAAQRYHGLEDTELANLRFATFVARAEAEQAKVSDIERLVSEVSKAQSLLQES